MRPGNRAEGPLTPGLVFEMLQAHQKTAALKAAIDRALAGATAPTTGSGPLDAR